jgi:formylglycine-generating enzyme required for sulfatase activity
MVRFPVPVIKTLVTLALVAALGVAGEMPKKFTETIKGDPEKAEGKDAQFDMVLLPGGTFVMGSPEDELDRREDEGPQHQVLVSPFYMATTEATLDLFMIYYAETVKSTRDDHAAPAPGARDVQHDPANPEDVKKIDNLKLAEIYSVDAVGGPTPIYGDLTMGWGGGKRPALAPTWVNAVNFCRWLSKKTGKQYRLPTEAEWEYACRAGTTTPFYFGEDPFDLEEYGWFEDNSDEMTHPVGEKKPNEWGLYDMHGNVREWCHDFYDPKAYANRAEKNPVKDPKGPAKPVGEDVDEAHKRYHVARGGAYNSMPEECRSAARGHERDSWRYKDPQYPKSVWWLPEQGHVGFRVVCEPESVKKK